MEFIFNRLKVIFGMNDVFRVMSYVILKCPVIIRITIRSTEYFSIYFRFQCNSAIILNSYKMIRGQLALLSYIFHISMEKSFSQELRTPMLRHAMPAL